MLTAVKAQHRAHACSLASPGVWDAGILCVFHLKRAHTTCRFVAQVSDVASGRLLQLNKQQQVEAPCSKASPTALPPPGAKHTCPHPHGPAGCSAAPSSHTIPGLARCRSMPPRTCRWRSSQG